MKHPFTSCKFSRENNIKISYPPFLTLFSSSYKYHLYILLFSFKNMDHSVLGAHNLFLSLSSTMKDLFPCYDAQTYADFNSCSSFHNSCSQFPTERNLSCLLYVCTKIPREHSSMIYLCIPEIQDRFLQVKLLGYFQLQRCCQSTRPKPSLSLSCHWCNHALPFHPQ